MRLAIISDVHANMLALEAVYTDIQSQRIDEIIFLGDLVMTGPRPQESYSLMKQLKPLVWLQGNTDNWLEAINDSFVPANGKEEFVKSLNDFACKRLGDAEKHDLAGRPIVQSLELGGINFTFCHGSPASFSQGIMPTMPQEELAEITASLNGSILCCGHTHTRFFLASQGAKLVNFGAVSMPGSDRCKSARYGIIDISSPDTVAFECRDVPFDIDEFFLDMKELDYPGLEMVRSKYGYYLV
jgi:putative phosphoesterase